MFLKRLSSVTLIAFIIAGSFFSSALAQNIPDPTRATGWSDSYSVDGQCYCDTNFDHGLSSVSVDTNDGRKPVTEICADIRSTFGTGPTQGRLYFNTVQCGHGPANNAADEAVCPGIPRATGNYTGNRCNETGATWNLDQLYPASAAAAPDPVAPEEPEMQNPVQQPVQEPATQGPANDEPTTPDTPTAPTTFPTCSAGVRDNDGDGYGFENNQSCLVDTDAAEVPTTPSTPDTPTAPTTFPTCSAGVPDNDGDGYGFENNQSCLIDADAAEVPTTPSTPDTPTGPTTFPTCSAGVPDNDGDGYGFENNQSCLIDSDAGEVPTTPTTPDTPTGPTTFPTCSAGVPDNDGDGYGFENNQSCLIDTDAAEVPTTPTTPDTPTGPTTFPTCSAGVPDNDGDGYGFENNQSCLIDTDAAEVPTTPTTPDTPTGPTTFPTCSAGVPDNDGDGYGFENNQSCLIDTDATPVPTAPATPDLPTEPEQPIGSCGTNAPNSVYNSATDLIVLHFDFGRDPDDGHAAVADKVLLDNFGIQNYLVVSGTNSRWQNNYISAANTLMDSLFGQGNWLLANILNNGTWNAAISASAQRWSTTLRNGGDIWIAEGGPGDFTAAVLRSIESTVRECNWQARIHVIQHSITNEVNTGRQQNEQRNNDLAYAQANTDYVKIDDGNGPNGTADLHANNATTAQNSTFVNLALSGSSSVEWQAGFQFLGPGTDSNAPVGNSGGKLDFSDTVELLHILQVPTSRVGDWNDFAREFF